MGELQPAHYLHGFINISNWLVLIVSAFIFRKNLTDAKSLGITTNPNLSLLQLIPYINILALPFMLRKVELQLGKVQGQKIAFGFSHSLVSSAFLSVGTILSQAPHFFIRRYFEHIEAGRSEEASFALKLAEEVLASNLFVATMVIATLGQAVFYFRIYKVQRLAIVKDSA